MDETKNLKSSKDNSSNSLDLTSELYSFVSCMREKGMTDEEISKEFKSVSNEFVGKINAGLSEKFQQGEDSLLIFGGEPVIRRQIDCANNGGHIVIVTGNPMGQMKMLKALLTVEYSNGSYIMDESGNIVMYNKPNAYSIMHDLMEEKAKQIEKEFKVLDSTSIKKLTAKPYRRKEQWNKPWNKRR